MLEGFYRIGQASKQLSISSYHLRRLCQAGAVEAELTSGNHWKIPISEISRLQQEGVPPIPQRLSEEDEPPTRPPEQRQARVPEGLYAEPSDGVIDAAEDVAITENRLRKRRLERELEEEEDFFRERDAREVAQQAADREAARKEQQRQQRRQWENAWIAYALRCVPDDAPKELELDVHGQVTNALTTLQIDQPEYAARRVIEAAVEKALIPWRRRAQRQQAIDAAINGLPFQLRYNRDFADQKQAVIRIATHAVDQARPDDGYDSLEAAAKHAVTPILKAFEHAQISEQVVAWTFVRGASSGEDEEAKELVQSALAKLPIGSSRARMERARDEALAPLLARIVDREQATVAKVEEQRLRRAVEWRVGSELGHIEEYLKEAYSYSGVYERLDDARRLREPIQRTLVEECEADPALDDDDIRSRIEELVDELL